MIVTAACHIHSEWSYDARWPLRDLATEFRRRGHRVVLVTEHDRGFSELRFQQYRRACAEVCSDDLLVIPGIEYSDSRNVVHILTWGLECFLEENLRTLTLLERVKAKNGVAVLAHPARRDAWKRYDASWTTHLTGIELWNRKADGWAPSRAATALLAETSLVAFASLDFHQAKQMFPLCMQLNISEPITEQRVLECLRTGHCRALAFSEPAEKFLTGWGSVALPIAERMRRTAAIICRQLKRAS